MPTQADGLRVRVPATSANLGPAFDTIGLALDLWLEADVTAASAFAIRFESAGNDALAMPTHEGFERQIVRGIVAVSGDELPRVTIHIRNPIPLGKGLGASAAANVLGATIAAQLTEGFDHGRLPRIVTELEGHPDNALPALLGGVVVAAQNEEAAPTFIRFPPPPGLRAVVVVPQVELATAKARAILPAQYLKRDVVYNIQRAALLASALASGDVFKLREAMTDRVHQPYRAALIPGLAEALALSAPALCGIALSGAGPSVLALVHGDGARIATEVAACFAKAGIASQAFLLELASAGTTVRSTAPEERRAEA